MSVKLKPLAPRDAPAVRPDRTPTDYEYLFDLDRLVRTLSQQVDDLKARVTALENP